MKFAAMVAVAVALSGCVPGLVAYGAFENGRQRALAGLPPEPLPDFPPPAPIVMPHPLNCTTMSLGGGFVNTTCN